jgi:hypothetical protein
MVLAIVAGFVTLVILVLLVGYIISIYNQTFRYYYNRNRPNQTLDGSTPAEEVLNWTVPSVNLFGLEYSRESS